VPKQLVVWLTIIVAATFASSLVATFVVRSVARRVGFVAKPRAERWHREPTALAGGVGIFAAFALASAVVGSNARMVLVGAAAMFVLGFLDDVIHLRPYAKLIGQVVIAALTVFTGPVLPWTSITVVDQGISVFWIIGITNAINLLDNMDGLAAGIACLAASFQAVFFVMQHQLPEAACATALAAALLGFLVFNWKPASIFMGDCGALFLGYTLSVLAMRSSYGRSRELLATMAAPVLLMLVPIFDTTFVTLVRIARGRPVSQGGRDHTSHRLVTLGLTERTAVSTLLAIGALGGVTAVLARIGWSAGIVVAGALLALMLVLFGIHLARTDRPETMPEEPNMLRTLAAFGYKRRVFEVLLDATLVMVAFVSAFLLRFDGDVPGEVRQTLSRVFLVVVATKLTVLLLMRAYGGVWRYADLRDLFRLAQAAAVGSVAVVVIIGLWLRFINVSRGALVIDALLFAALLMASRVSFRLLRFLVRTGTAAPDSGTRVLLWGAGDLGEQLAQRLVEHVDVGLVPVGFIDDDPLKSGRIIHGLPVYGDSGKIAGLLDQGIASLVVITSPRIPAERVASVVSGVGPGRIRRMRLSLEDVAAELRALPPAPCPSPMPSSD
jgi:UDP-GlcNAc:undecaprenyl-phosphate GlcNAc-1-phosphate transferase